MRCVSRVLCNWIGYRARRIHDSLFSRFDRFAAKARGLLIELSRSIRVRSVKLHVLHFHVIYIHMVQYIYTYTHIYIYIYIYIYNAKSCAVHNGASVQGSKNQFPELERSPFIIIGLIVLLCRFISDPHLDDCHIVLSIAVSCSHRRDVN